MTKFLIISTSYEEHLYLLRLVEDLLSKVGLTINTQKNPFSQEAQESFEKLKWLYLLLVF